MERSPGSRRATTYHIMVYEINLSIDIHAPVSRVWHALCDPAEVVQWDGSVSQALDAPPDYPQAGQHVRWRLRSGLFRKLHDRPIEVVPGKKLRSLLSLGPYEMDETYLLTETPDGTQIDLNVELRVRMPIIGPAIERWFAGPGTCRGFEASLQGLKHYCEQQAP